MIVSMQKTFTIYLTFLMVSNMMLHGLAGNSSIDSLHNYPDAFQAAPTARLINQRLLANAEEGSYCDSTAKSNPTYQRYFDGMKTIYKENAANTCLSAHMECGWPAVSIKQKKLPLLVLSVGLEGAGHHLWKEILMEPVVDCVWINGRHYRRDIADGVPRLTSEELYEGIQTQFDLRKNEGLPACKKVFDAEDSFPTGAIRKTGRLFCRPDLINVQKLDGILYDVKYLIIARNVTDTALSALRRNFFLDVDSQVRTVEHTLTYLESALRGVPCHRIFIAHYEQALRDPRSFVGPLSSFLELDKSATAELTRRLSKKGRFPSRKEHKLTQFAECKKAGLSDNLKECSQLITNLLDRFFHERNFMWPTFAANGFDFIPKFP